MKFHRKYYMFLELEKTERNQLLKLIIPKKNLRF